MLDERFQKIPPCTISVPSGVTDEISNNVTWLSRITTAVGYFRGGGGGGEKSQKQFGNGEEGDDGSRKRKRSPTPSSLEQDSNSEQSSKEDVYQRVDYMTNDFTTGYTSIHEYYNGLRAHFSYWNNVALVTHVVNGLSGVGVGGEVDSITF